MTSETLSFGDVVWVDFPFADSEGIKARPAVVVSADMYHSHRPDVIVAAISSRLYVVEPLGEFVITQWQEVGLTKPSKVKAFVATIKRNRIIHKMGRLSATDQQKLEHLLSRSIGRAHA